MIIIEKENVFIVLLAIILVILVIININKGETKEVFVQGLPLSGRVVVIDAGHGGKDKGAEGKSDTKEAELNLDITLKLQKYLELAGSYVVLTRADENGLYDEGVRNMKRDDMKKRKNIINSSNADLLLSIHQNYFPESVYKGAQVFYKKDCNISKEIAKNLQQQFKGILDINNDRVEKGTDDYYLLKNSDIPAIIIECGFLSNEEEERNLKNSEYQENLVWAIYKAISIYYSNAKT